MIYHCTFMYTAEQMNVANGFGNPVLINPWEVYRHRLENSADTFVWIVTAYQLDPFMEYVRKYDLEKFLTVRMDDPKVGVTNRNYMSDPGKLKVFVMKGIKKHEQAAV